MKVKLVCIAAKGRKATSISNPQRSSHLPLLLTATRRYIS
jgi:hypothetical protein